MPAKKQQNTTRSTMRTHTNRIGMNGCERGVHWRRPLFYLPVEFECFCCRKRLIYFTKLWIWRRFFALPSLIRADVSASKAFNVQVASNFFFQVVYRSVLDYAPLSQIRHPSCLFHGSWMRFCPTLIAKFANNDHGRWPLRFHRGHRTRITTYSR